jgi:hypothetical protein
VSGPKKPDTTTPGMTSNNPSNHTLQILNLDKPQPDLNSPGGKEVASLRWNFET